MRSKAQSPGVGDSLSIGLSWYLERRAHRAGDGQYSYGYRRLSLLGALINALVLILGSVLILMRAAPRLLQPERLDAGGMLALALLGIAVNGVGALRMRSGRNLNARMITWHLLEDLFGWVAVLVVSLALLFTDAYILDPLLSILITGFVLYNVVRNLRRTLAIFLQAAPEDVDVHSVQRQLEIQLLPGVARVGRPGSETYFHEILAENARFPLFTCA